MRSHKELVDMFFTLEIEEGRFNLHHAYMSYYGRKRNPHIHTEKRKPLSSGQRDKLYRQQEGRCALCKEPYPLRMLVDDHIVALALGGTNHLRNRRLICSKENSSKGANDVFKENKLGHGSVIEQLNSGGKEDPEF